MKTCNDKVSVWKVFFFIALTIMGGVITSTRTWAQQVQGSGDINLGSSATRDPATQFTLDAGMTWQDAYILNVPNVAYASPLPGTRYISEDAMGNGHTETIRRYRTVIWPCSCPRRFVPALTSFLVHADNAARLSVNGVPIGSQNQAEISANFVNPPEDLLVAPFSFSAQPGPVLLKSGPNILEIDLHNFNGVTALNYKAIVECRREKRTFRSRDDDDHEDGDDR